MSDLVEKSRKKYLKFNLEFKLKVIVQHTVFKKSFTECESMFKVDRRIISKWVKMENAIKETTHKRTTFRVKKKEKGFGRFPQMEIALNTWFLEQRVSGACINGTNLKDRAKAIHLELNNTSNLVEFRASDGWLSNFLFRFLEF